MLGLQLDAVPPGPPDAELSAVFERDIERLAEMEHGRFTMERLLSGWTDGVRDRARFVFPHLLPWTVLDDEAKEFDRQVMRDVPLVLAMHGLARARCLPDLHLLSPSCIRSASLCFWSFGRGDTCPATDPDDGRQSMPIFVSYSRHNEEVIKQLVRGLEGAHKQVWYDFQLDGGEIWWTRILAGIRDCTVFVFGLSDHSLRSKACMTEYDYANTLGKPILPVLVGRVETELANPLASLHFVAYRPDDADAGFQVLSAVDAAERRAGPLPEVLPPEPQMPHAYLRHLARQIDTAQLNYPEQETAVEQLRRALRVETDPHIRQQVISILRNLGSKRWIAKQTEHDIQTVLLMEVPPEDGDSAKKNEDDAESLPPATGGDEADQPPKPKAVEANGQRLFDVRMAEVKRRLDEEERRKAREEALGTTWELPRLSSDGGAADPGESRHAPIWPGITATPEPVWSEPPRPDPPPWSEASTTAAPGPPPHGQPQQASVAPQPLYGPPPPPAQPYTMTVSCGAGAPARVSPPNHWALSIVAFLFSFVFGGIAMYFSYQVGQRFSAHDDDGAMRASRNAKAWGIVGIVVGVIVFFAIIGS